MLGTRKQIWKLTMALLALAAFVPKAELAVGSLTRSQADPCVDGSPVVVENCLTGSPSSEWYVDGPGDQNIQGFGTDISVNTGDTVHFKIDTDASAYHIDVYRLGYYHGNGARNVGTGVVTATLPQIQDPCLYDTPSGMTDCGNWVESGHWDVPSNAVSGIYVAKLTRDDATPGTSHITFVVRDDASTSDLLFQTSDATWQAYNLYGGKSVYPAGGGPPGFNHATKASYNRPWDVRHSDGSPGDNVFAAEYPMVRWLEANGYDVSYTSSVDTDRRGGLIQQHRVFLSVGHDEYWSGPQRANVTTARDAGVHLAFFSGNEVYWKTRYEASIDGSNTPYRTLVVYKEGTLGENGCGFKCDPTPAWTGLWRDGCAPNYDPVTNGACLPENALTGQISWDGTIGAIQVPHTFKDLRFWRNTSIATLNAGESRTLSSESLGSEWDWENATYAGSYPARRILLSTTVLNSRTHHLSLYRADSGALVFAAGTIQWSWGLDDFHTFNPVATNQDMRQATVNLFADMGAVPETLQPGLVPAAASSDTVAPASVITSPADGATVALNGTMNIQGTAADSGGGVVAGVEVSVDGGATWHAATGTTAWSYAWSPTAEGPATIKSRAYDDTGNLETAGSTGSPNVVGVTVTAPVCPCTVFPPTEAPGGPRFNDNQPNELGMKFRSDVNGYITALRYYKLEGTTGTHTGNLWTGTGTNIARQEFTNESTSGWQEVTLSTPVEITAGTTYVVSYFSPSGDYAATQNYFTQQIGSGRVHGLANGTDGPNGLYDYTGTTAFPTQSFLSSNYYADVVFVTSIGPDLTPPVITAVAATPHADGSATITWSTNESASSHVDYGTDPDALSQQASSASLTTTHSIVLTGLIGNTTYYYRVTSEDASANSATSPVPPALPASFTTTLPPCLVDQTSADFALGSAAAGIAIAGSGDGELILAPTLSVEFDGASLPADWMQMDWDSPGVGTVTVGGGTVTVDGARTNPTSLTGYGPGIALEYSARFQPENFEAVGFGAGDNSLAGLMSDLPFAVFGPSDGTEVEARSGPAGGPQTKTTIAGLTGAFHRYRIEWGATEFKFYVDEVLRATHPSTGIGSMRPAISDYNQSGLALTVDWLRMSPYASAGTFTSRVFDAGNTTTWGSALWSADVPIHTSIVVSVRTGPTPVPDGSWTVFTTLPTSGSSIGVSARYIQYQAELATTNTLLTPVLRDVTATCSGASDETPPVITNVTATPAANGLSALVTWTTNEPADSQVDYGTDPGALSLSESAPSLVTSHGLNLTGLTGNTTYYYRVRSEDGAQNAAVFPEPPAAPLSFTTTTYSECLAESTTSDFSQGTTGVSTYVSETGDGEVILAPAIGAEFSGTSLPSGWISGQWQPPGGSVTVSGGAVTLNGYDIKPSGYFGPYGTLEAVATFTAETFQHAGLENFDGPGGPYAIFSTYNTTNQVWARIPGTDTPISGSASWIGTPHLYRLAWQPGSVEFWVDGVFQVTLSTSNSTPMRPWFSDFGLGGEDLSVNWARLSPYPSSGTFESRVYDAGTPVAWAAFSWAADTPAGTSLAMSVRTGDTPVPDGTWSTYATVASSGASVGSTSRYIQYQADLSTSDPARTPALLDVSVYCAPACVPTTEVCNGLDDDCDGSLDENGAALCADGNGCTDDSCNGAAGCGHVNNTAACDDGNSCTQTDVCTGGVCAGTAISCNDNNLCTDDSCSPSSGCIYTPDDTNLGLITCGQGVCERTVAGCLGGQPQTCTPGPVTGSDNDCNGVDENCNGTADENYVPTPTSCGGVGVCGGVGQLICTASGLQDTCTPGTPATANVAVQFNTPTLYRANVTGAPEDITLVALDSAMRYLANASDPGVGTTWTAELFDEGSTPWTGGTYGVGYETATAPPWAVDLIRPPQVPSGTYSVYTRAEFSIADPTAVKTMFIGADFDDGWIAWINGVEVARSSTMPAGAPAWNTNAALHESSNAASPNYGTLVDITSTALPVLHAGTNVLAVGVWNSAALTSTDLVLVPKLSIGTDWTHVAYDDSSWSAGAFGVGYESSPPGAESLIVNPPVPAGTVSVFTRTTFNVANPALVQELFLGADYDDGFVAWINGVEVYGSPEIGPSTAWDAGAASHESSNGTTPNYGALIDVSALGLPALHAGDNVLAVGVWNTNSTSTDMVIVPRLSLGEAETCDGLDNDCNGVVDEGYPDLDGDGVKDCVDPDDDGDSVPDGSDCAPWDSASSVGPLAEVTNLAWGLHPEVLRWTEQGAGVRYDVVTGTLAAMRTAGGVMGASCLADDRTSGAFDDTRPAPAPGEGYYYLVRAQKASCENGTYGYASSLAERVVPALPCP